MDTGTSQSTSQPYLARRQNWITHLARHALMQPDATALRFIGRTITWAELAERVSRLASALHRRGVAAGDRVMILMLNRPEFIEAALAASRLGAIAVPVNFRLTPPELAYLVENCGASVLITEPLLAPVAAAVRELAPVHNLIVAETPGDGTVIGFEDLIAEDGEDAPPVDIPPDSPALIMYTSGTTGHPKGAVLTHSNLAGQVMTALYTNPPHLGHDVGFIGVPLFHIAGIGNVLPAITLGAPTVVYPLGAFNPGELLDVLEAEGVTGIFLVPAQWQAVCAEQQARPRTLRLRTLSWGAAPTSDTLLREMAQTFPGCNIVAAFGQTEMSPVTCMLLGEDAIRKLGSVGKVIPTVAARIVDDNMNDVATGDVGEIASVSPSHAHRTTTRRAAAPAPVAAPAPAAGSASTATSSPTQAFALNLKIPAFMRSSSTSRISWSPGSTGRLKRAASMPA